MKDVACEPVLFEALAAGRVGRGFFGGRNDLADPFLPHNDRAALNANRREQYHVVAHQKNQSLINPEFGSAVTVISSGGGSLHTEWKIIGS